MVQRSLFVLIKLITQDACSPPPLCGRCSPRFRPAPPPLKGADLLYEPKYDGIRAIALVEPAKPRAKVRFWSRLGNEKTAQFPELVDALGEWGSALKAPVVLDGEIVALDRSGKTGGVSASAESYPCARSRLSFVQADRRRQRAAHRVHRVRSPPRRRRRPAHLAADRATRPSRGAVQAGASRRTLQFACRNRSPAMATPLRTRQERRLGRPAGQGGTLAVPGWQAQSRMAQAEDHQRRGIRHRRLDRAEGRAQLLRIADSRHLRRRRASRARRRRGHRHSAARSCCGSGSSSSRSRPTRRPFTCKPKTLGRPHWAKPKLVAQVRFTEWTDDGRLRHPTYLGLRDDKKPEDVKTTRGAQATPSHRRAMARSASTEARRRVASATPSKPSGAAAVSRRKRAARGKAKPAPNPLESMGGIGRRDDRAARRLRASASTTASCSCRTATRSTCRTCRRSSGRTRSTPRAISFATTRASRR